MAQENVHVVFYHRSSGQCLAAVWRQQYGRPIRRHQVACYELGDLGLSPSPVQVIQALMAAMEAQPTFTV